MMLPRPKVTSWLVLSAPACLRTDWDYGPAHTGVERTQRDEGLLMSVRRSVVVGVTETLPDGSSPVTVRRDALAGLHVNLRAHGDEGRAPPVGFAGPFRVKRMQLHVARNRNHLNQQGDEPA